MIRAFALALLLLYTSVNGVDAAHGLSHAFDAGHDESHEPCELCDWDAVVVPEPEDAVEVPGSVKVGMPLEHVEAGHEQLNARERHLGLADRGPPENI
jgi:hypothetical protein